MEPQAPYEKEDAQSIIANYLNDWVEWRDDGLFIRQDFTENDVTGSFFQWTPACDMEWDGAPDPKTAPSLPFPFTASQLAAFMLNGIGSIVASAYGTWEDGPGEADMDEVMNVRARKAREALRKAFSLYRDAEKAVGELAPEVRDESRSMHPAILRVQGRKSELQATLKHLSWCRAMTRQLLHPQAATPSPAPEPQAPPVGAVGASGGVETDKAGPVPLTTGDIAFCFAGLRWKTESEWKKPLGDKPKWLVACIAIPGAQGVSATRWNPVSIGAALVHNGHVQQHSVRAKFQTMDLLKPWLEEWKTYEADNLATE